MKNRFFLTMIASALLTGNAIAEDRVTNSVKMGESAVSIENDNVIFYANTNKLKIPVVHHIDANGNMTDTLYSAELDLTKINEDGSYEFKVFKLDQTDIYGCVLPETWQESMGHCMVQN